MFNIDNNIHNFLDNPDNSIITNDLTKKNNLTNTNKSKNLINQKIINNNNDNHNNNKVLIDKKIFCSNCNKTDHFFKQCKFPITSYGILLIKIDDDDIVNDILNFFNNNNFNNDDYINDTGIFYRNDQDILNFCKYKNKIKFLMIRRKNSLGYIEFMRGHYDIDNIDGITHLFKQMTKEEIKKIEQHDFDYLWKDLWFNKKFLYNKEYSFSKKKYNNLKNKKTINLSFFIDYVKPLWKHAEWGFPKGRKNFQENPIDCAVREFQEETNFLLDDIFLLSSLPFLDERLIGTNGVNYKHIYYPAIFLSHKSPIIDSFNISQFNEIGDIGFFTYYEALKLVRDHHIERKKILTQIYTYIINIILNIKK